MSKTNFTRKYKESKYLTPTRYSKSGIEMHRFKIEKNFHDKGFKRSVISLYQNSKTQQLSKCYDISLSAINK